eukprot:605349-Pelagomonas_calceolata.AAC.7
MKIFLGDNVFSTDHDWGWNNGNRRLPRKTEFKNLFLDALGEPASSPRRNANNGIQVCVCRDTRGQKRVSSTHKNQLQAKLRVLIAIYLLSQLIGDAMRLHCIHSAGLAGAHKECHNEYLYSSLGHPVPMLCRHPIHSTRAPRVHPPRNPNR